MGRILIYSISDIEESALLYSNKRDWARAEQAIFVAAKRYGIFEEVTKHFTISPWAKGKERNKKHINKTK